MPFDILDKNNHPVTSAIIPASASAAFAFTISHHGGPSASQQLVSIEAPVGTVLGWNSSKLDTTGKKVNTLGPSGSPHNVGDGVLTIKVGSGGHAETQTFAFRFEKQG